MKIHYSPSIETNEVVWLDTTPCGTGPSPSGVYHGVQATSVASAVTCKRCLKKLEDKIVSAEVVPLTAEERLARIAEYIRGEGDIDTESAFDFINGRNSVLRVMRDLIEDKH